MLVEPSVSTAGSLRTSARRRDMRNTPSASATVTTAGSPSGTAATARLTEVINSSKGWVPRSKPNPNSRATIPKVAQTSTRPKASSLRSSGVPSSAPASAMSPAVWPNSVCIAVATTTAWPVPAAILVPMKTMFSRSPSATSTCSKRAAFFVTTSDSPVSAASLHLSAAACKIRASAATKSPASRARMSPETISWAGIESTCPSRRTFACGAVIFLSAAMDFSALYSW